jgi:DNA replication protein DnaC
VELATLAFVDNHHDLLITGKSGTGKSHILQALALRGCERELRVCYTRCVDLIDDLRAASPIRPTSAGSGNGRVNSARIDALSS